MAQTRVFELAKSLGISVDELLGKLAELNIAAKSRAFPLTEEQVAAVKKAMSAASEPTETDEEREKRLAEEAKQKEERRAAMEAERRARDAERARRGGVPTRPAEPVRTASRDTSAPAKQTEQPRRIPTTASSGVDKLADQIAQVQERERLAKEQAAAAARAERLREEVAKKQAVEESLRQRGKKPAKQGEGTEEKEARPRPQAPVEPQPKIQLRPVEPKPAQERPQQAPKAAAEQKQAGKPAAEQKPAPKPAPVSAPTKRFDSLLSQIESEKQRMAQAKDAKPAGKKQGQAQTAPSGARAQKQSAKGGKQAHVFEPDVPELQERARVQLQEQPAPSQDRGRGGAQGQGRGGKQASSGKGRGRDTRNESFDEGEDRYAQMAAAAEKLQRDKVLADARAAVAAAETESGGRRKKRKEKREAEAREQIVEKAIERGIDPSLLLDETVVQVPQGSTVAQFSELLGVQPNDVIKRLFMLGQILTLTQSMSDDLMELVADDMGRKIRVISPEEEFAVVYHDSEEDLKPRPPVVTVMGHVDHGKTSLLDAIRHTGVTATEAGGITQHIGASVVDINGKQITFIDTPGHEAFTAMRARGAQVTDVIVLVVAADDGVMPQTVEAINHAKAADVPIVVAINKIDKPGANPDKVRQELVEYGVISEEWGGQNMFVEVSAKKHLHIDDLLETIILQADVLELKANPDAIASGFVIEANLDKGRGPVATVLVQRGTLRPGDTVVAGTSYGRVRALINPRGEHVSEAKPADPVEILGLSSVPTAGDEFRVFEDERDARKLAEERALRARLAEQEAKAHMSLDDLFSRIEEGKQTDLNLIVKADVQGSIEALRDAFSKMDQSEVRINIVHSAVGGITETDVTLAAASDAIIIGFNVRPTGKSKAQAEREKVDIRLYRVIYQALEEINAARVGLLKPEIVEEDTGVAEVRETFRVPKVGTIAGCYITEGEIARDNRIRIVRDGMVIFEGSIGSLKRFKDDVKSVRQGYECGIGINGFQDLKVGDTIEGYVVKEIERTE